VLTVADGAVFADSLANTAALRLDERYDVPGLGFWRLFLAIAPFGQGSTIACFDPNGTRLADIATSLDSVSNLELQLGGTPGSFAPFQPDAGEQLSYRAITWCFPNCTTAEVRTLRPQRPLAAISGPGLGNPGGGLVTLDFDGCVPNASLMLVLGPQSSYTPAEQTIFHPDGFLWHSGLEFSQMRRLVLLTTDANGQASFSYTNPGSWNGTHAFQALVRDANGLFVGSSTSVLN